MPPPPQEPQPGALAGQGPPFPPFRCACGLRFAATKEAWGVCLPVCQPTKLVAKPGCMQRNGLCCVWTATLAATGAARGGHARRASRTLAARSIHSVALLWHIPENQGEILALGRQHFVLLLQLFDCGLCLGIVHSGSEQFRGGPAGGRTGGQKYQRTLEKPRIYQRSRR